MPIEYNPERAEFFPASDLAYALGRDRALQVLTTWDTRELETINDCIEAHQCKLIVETHGHLFPGGQLAELCRAASHLYGLACRRAVELLREFGLSALYESVEVQYLDHFWAFAAGSSLDKQLQDDEVFELLMGHPEALRLVLECEELVKNHGEPIAKAMSGNPHQAAEIIIEAFGAQRRGDERTFLPGPLGSSQIDEIMLAYMAGDDPHPNLLGILAAWPASGQTVYHPSAEIKVAAKRKSEELVSALLAEGTSFRTVSGVQFDPQQEACVGIVLEDGGYTTIYGTGWLVSCTDPGTVLNNFIYLFGYLSRDGLLTVPAHLHEQSALLAALGPHAADEYPRSLSFGLREEQALMALLGYRRILLECGTRLEDAIEWFFKKYLPEEFGVSGFCVNLPAEGASFLDKCHAVGPEIEGVIKAWRLYVTKGKVDHAYFPHVAVKRFADEPSLIPGKYLVAGERFEGPAFWMFSDQSMIAHSAAHKGCNSFFEMVRKERTTIGDFHERYAGILTELQDAGFIVIGDDGAISPTVREALLYWVWVSSALPAPRLSDSKKAVAEKLVDEGYLECSSALFSPDEAAYLNYMFNNAVFSDSIALRNKYDHASGAIDNPDSKEIEADYCRLLMLLVFILLKINDELCLSTGGGGLGELVDWPLYDEGSFAVAFEQLSGLF